LQHRKSAKNKPHHRVGQVLELSSARRALSALIEEDADGYSIAAAIEHARRVGVDAEVRDRFASDMFLARDSVF
jgi:hypothetical protein